MAQLAEFARLAGEECARCGVVLTIEHLNRNETNTLNSLADSLALCERVAHPAVGTLVDAYHFGVEGETDQAILDLGARIRHVHVVEPVGRVQPGAYGPHGSHPDAFDFVLFFRVLRQTGYDEGLSIEGRWTQPLSEAAAQSAATLREAWQLSAG
jgi:sugar phosphate isomerase/epimerase